MSLTFSLQALLHRHETYVTQAEDERSRMLVDMEKLEQDKREIQAANARIVEDNRNLLEQLEGLNNAVVTSDGLIKNLTERLEQTHSEMRKLVVSAARASELESQLSAMEAEQLQLQQELILTQEDGKSAMQRWKKAESTLRDLQDQLDQLEYEARTEREQHAQIVERMERRRAVERELEGAAGRLKGAAAAAAMDRNKKGGTVVSKFVRDILQDNTNLQTGILELREMLESSNQEVENLRDQILQHQPLETEADHQQQTSRLDEELGAQAPGPMSQDRPMSQEFHVHHHYHSPSSSSSKKEKTNTIRRPKKKRPPVFIPSGLHSPKSSYHRAQHSSSSTSTIMSQTSVSIPPSQRYPLHSPGISSLASSPQSAYRSSSIFDVMSHGYDSSRPTSPESAAFASPKVGPRRPNRLSDVSVRSFSVPTSLQGMAPQSLDEDEPIEHPREEELLEHTEQTAPGDDIWLPPAIPEEQEEPAGHDHSDADTVTEEAPGPDVEEETFVPLEYHTLQRSTSHESLLSVSGMDIHTLRDRPSQLLLGMSSRYFYQRPRIVSAGTELSSTPPVISTTNITADKGSMYNPSRKSSHSLLASVAANHLSPPPSSERPDNAHSIVSRSTNSNSIPIPGKAATIGRKVGGWVLGRWGVAPTPSMGDLRHAVTSDDASTMSTESTSQSVDTAAAKVKPVTATTPPFTFLIGRAPGINQKGPIPGFRAPAPTPVALHVSALDEDLLKESLNE